MRITAGGGGATRHIHSSSPPLAPGGEEASRNVPRKREPNVKVEFPLDKPLRVKMRGDGPAAEPDLVIEDAKRVGIHRGWTVYRCRYGPTTGGDAPYAPGGIVVDTVARCPPTNRRPYPFIAVRRAAPGRFVMDCAPTLARLKAVLESRPETLPPNGSWLPHCPDCGRRFADKDLVDADFFFSISRLAHGAGGKKLWWGSLWRCRECAKRTGGRAWKKVPASFHIIAHPALRRARDGNYVWEEGS